MKNNSNLIYHKEGSITKQMNFFILNSQYVVSRTSAEIEEIQTFECYYSSVSEAAGLEKRP